jgi:hypothetical protein
MFFYKYNTHKRISYVKLLKKKLINFFHLGFQSLDDNR